LRNYPDVRGSGVNPFVHYVVHGRNEGRKAVASGAWPDPLPDTPWYMDLAARAKPRWKACPQDLREDVSAFIEDGYLLLRGSIPQELVTSARRDFFQHKEKYAELYARFQDRNGFNRRIANLHMSLDVLKDVYAQNQRALRIQDFLFGVPSVCYSGLFFEAGSEQDLHRDSPYFCTVPEYYYLGVWVALEEVDRGNGALEIIDGGHLVHEPDRDEIVDRFYSEGQQIASFDMRLWDAYQAETMRLCQKANRARKTVAMNPGDTLIWHPHLPHGGAPIFQNDRSRLSVVNHVIAKGACFGGMELFFHRCEPPASVNYECFSYGGREFVKHETVSFAHQFDAPADELAL
jgi:hypothetical protein